MCLLSCSYTILFLDLRSELVSIWIPIHGVARDRQEASHRCKSMGVHVSIELLQFGLENRLNCVNRGMD